MAKPGRNAYRPHNPRWFNRLLRFTYGIYLGKRFRIHCIGKEIFDTLKPPFVIIPNHVALLDSLLVGSNVPQPIYWIASDGNMRTTIMRFVLKLVGAIPKSKYIPDLETINAMVEVVRKRKGVIGIFPEGTATFDGHTQDLVPATGKLLKLLKIPVVTAIVKGAYSSMPRWAWTNRFGQVEIEFKLAFSTEELKQLKADEVLLRLRAALEYDEADWQQERHIPFYGKARAENLETVLFHCPACGNSESMRSVGHRFLCTACGVSWYLDRFYNFHPKNRNGSPYNIKTIRDWSLWQAEAYTAKVLKRVGTEGRDATLLINMDTSIYRGRKLDPLRKINTGQLVLYPDRIELQTGGHTHLCFPLGAIEGEGVFKRNFLEFHHGRILYQGHFPERSASARKWLMTLGILRRSGLDNPLLP